ncbi:hypothetical protein [Algiphilus sp.]|uniref:hypothetical protein n=1 Tax=Algiphilus sp. TaxID=1872431 RepID=UPI003B52656F
MLDQSHFLPSNDYAAAGGALSGRTTAARSGAGAPPSNTAPGNCNSGDRGGKPLVLKAGLDSLYLSYYGRVYGDMQRRLDAKKEQACESDLGLRAQAQILLADERLEVASHGRKGYRFVLRNTDFDLGIADRPGTKFPQAYCKVSSACLLRDGQEEAVRKLTAIIDALIERDGSGPNVSRVDLYVDACEPFDLDSMNRSDWVCRARDIQDFGSVAKRTGFVFGRRGVILARIYDKTEEIKHSGKDYWKVVWHQAGWEPPKRVIRVEFQLRGEALKSLGFQSLDKLFTEAGQLWRYCTTEWLRLAVPVEGDTTRSRWPTHPAWQTIAELAWDGSETAKRVDVHIARAPRDEVLISRFVSAITGVMAKYDIADPFFANTKLLGKAVDFHDGMYFVRDEGFEDHLRKKAALKAKQWHLPFHDYLEKGEEQFKEAERKAYQRTKRNLRDKSDDWDQDWDADIPGLDGDQE